MPASTGERASTMTGRPAAHASSVTSDSDSRTRHHERRATGKRVPLLLLADRPRCTMPLVFGIADLRVADEHERDVVLRDRSRASARNA